MSSDREVVVLCCSPRSIYYHLPNCRPYSIREDACQFAGHGGLARMATVLA